MERRNHNRFPVKLDVLVHDKMYHSWDFVVVNFGLDGLQLNWSNPEPMPDDFHINDLLSIHFEIEQEDTVQSYELDVNIVRIHHNSIAVSLFNPALDAISELSRQQRDISHADSSLVKLLDKQSLNIFQLIEQSYLKNIAQITELFFPIVHDVFFKKAQYSDNNNEQAIFFDSISTLNKTKDSLKSQFLKKIEDDINHYSIQPETIVASEESTELELIDRGEFENWLTVNQLIIETAPHHKQELTEIRLRLADLLAVDEKRLKKIPFSPEVIFREFSVVIHQYFLNNNVLLILYTQFEKVVDNYLSDTYKEINQIFIENNILPVISNEKFEIQKQVEVDEKRTSSNNKPAIEEAEKHTQSDTASAAILVPVLQHQTELTSIANPINLVPAYQTLKEVLSFQNGQNPLYANNDFFFTEAYKVQLSFLINDLTLIQKNLAKHIEQQGMAVTDLSVLVQECMKKDVYAVELRQEFEYTLDIIKRLFASINEDTWLGKPVKKLLLQLQLPLLKVVLLNKDFFDSWSNPVRMMINKLAMVDFDDEKNHFYLKARSFVLYLLNHFNEDLQLFSKVEKTLSDLLKIQANHYNKKVNYIIDNWTVQQVVTNELASRLAGRSIPVILANFISYQWLPILVSTYMSKGKSSIQWSQYLQALDMLILSVNDDVSEEFIDNDVIVFIVKQGLEENGLYNKKIIDDIQSFLQHKESANSINLKHDVIIKLLINGYALSDKTALHKINRGITDARRLATNAIVKRLKINDYLFFKQNNKIKRIQLIWESDSQNVFVFAGRSGRQEAVFNRVEVIEMFDSGLLTQTRDFDLPLLERSLYAVMGQVHDDIAKKGTLDPLTGLITQKHFILLFNKMLQQKKAPDYQCALCLIDIDQFSLINDVCGYEAGDHYIAELSQLLINNLSADIILGRYGVDTIILMLPEHNTKQALEISEQLRTLINHYNYKWDGKNFTLSASIGLVAVNESDDAGVFLKAVVTATTIAREMGRNRVHFLEYDAVELNHRQELQVWASKVNQMVKMNQFNVRCQRLHPLLDHSTRQHYEMLLLVKDESGEYIPPGEFIEAAELYNKMDEVDRWVINFVFNWFSQHPEQLEIMGGIAINLSGQSLNDVDFLAFIERMFMEYPDIPHDKICFEITETMAISNMNYANNIIHAIKEMGCEFSLDDFGTGLSSYAYLKNLPVDYLKIDGVFIKDIINSPADQAMVKSINEIGHFLGMKTVAEFVMSDEIITLLQEIGVDYAQGYAIEKPVLLSDYMKESPFAIASDHAI